MADILTEMGLAVQSWKGKVNSMSCEVARDCIHMMNLSVFCEGRL